MNHPFRVIARIGIILGLLIGTLLLLTAFDLLLPVNVWVVSQIKAIFSVMWAFGLLAVLLLMFLVFGYLISQSTG